MKGARGLPHTTWDPGDTGQGTPSDAKIRTSEGVQGATVNFAEFGVWGLGDGFQDPPPVAAKPAKPRRMLQPHKDHARGIDSQNIGAFGNCALCVRSATYAVALHSCNFGRLCLVSRNAARGWSQAVTGFRVDGFCKPIPLWGS